MKTSEGNNLVWYDTFNVFEVTSPDHAGHRGILPVQLRFTINAAAIASADFAFEGDWRSKVWDTWTLKAWNMNGEMASINDNVTFLGNPTRATAKSLLDWQTMVVANQDEMVANATTPRLPVSELTVYVTAFIVDGVAPAGTSTFTYLKLDDGNEALFIFDGVEDHQFQNIVYIAKPSASAPCTISASDMTLVLGETKTLTVSVGDTCACTTVSWDVVSQDFVEVSGDDPKAYSLTGLKVGSFTNKVHVSCDPEVSKDVTITVVTATPTVTPTSGGGSSSGGGCNAGAFAPLMLLLVAPVVLLLKK